MQPPHSASADSVRTIVPVERGVMERYHVDALHRRTPGRAECLASVECTPRVYKSGAICLVIGNARAAEMAITGGARIGKQFTLRMVVRTERARLIIARPSGGRKEDPLQAIRILTPTRIVARNQR